MVRRLIVAALLAAALLVPASADAAPSIKKSIWGPIDRDGVDQFPIYEDLGVGIYQMVVHWDTVAPTRPARPRDPSDPAYQWPAEVDLALSRAAPRGIEVAVMLLGAPRWANGGRSWRWAPKRPADFGRFAAAASTRWPGVRHWIIWGEPSKAENFQPLTRDGGRPLRGRGLRGPRRYARMLDASFAELKRTSPRNLVIGGNTFTVGAVAPLRYIKALRMPSGRRPRMDMWGHNPFSLREPDLSNPPLGNGFADFSDLDTLVRAVDRAMRHSRRAQRRLPIFLSEYSLPTDHANHEFNFFVDHQTQAKWIGLALDIVRGWDRLYTFGYLGLYDDGPRPGGDQVERGLITFAGERKLAYDAYRDG